MDTEFNLKNYLAILRRRYLYLLVPAAVIFIVACAVTYLLPASYQSTARILVESQQIPSDLARSTVTANAAERVQIIKQRIMTRDNLLAVARKHNLYGDRVRLSPSEVVDLMRTAAQIEQVDIGDRRSPRAPGQTIAFTVSYSYANPTIASRVTNEFVTLILEQNIEARTRRATETSRFFAQQVASLENELVALEARIVQFKNANESALPENLAYRRSLLPQLQNELAELSPKIAALEDKKRALDHPGAAVEPNNERVAAELDRLRGQLLQMRGIYSESHPNVRAVRSQISALENGSQLIKNSVNTNRDRGAKAELANTSSDQRTGGNVASTQNSGQLALVQAQLQELEAQRAKLQQRIAGIDESIQKTPQVEIALKSLSRGYETLQQQQNQARTKMAEAEVGERMEADRQAERFEVIEQATVPIQPTSPNRPLLIFGGAFGSLAAGIGVLVLAEFLDQRIRTVNDLVQRLQLRPLATIPYVSTQQERKRKRRTLIVVSGCLIALACAGTVAVHFLYSPLPMLFIMLSRSLGLNF